MTKKLISTIALVLILQGCGSSTTNNKKEESNTTSSKVSNEVKSFAKGLSIGNTLSSVVKSTSSSQSSSSKTQTEQKTTLDSCDNGGTRKIISDTDFENMDRVAMAQILKDGVKLTMVTDNCIEDGTKSNGSISIITKGQDLDTAIILFIEDSTFEELETTEIVTVFKNSTITIEELSDEKEIVTETLKASNSTGKSYQSINLVTHSTFSNNNESTYEVSGEMVHDGIIYRVDEQYDGSKTPIIFENYEDLVSGTSKYYNEKNHHITITVVDKNQIKISVDTDNDGDSEEEEIIDL